MPSYCPIKYCPHNKSGRLKEEKVRVKCHKFPSNDSMRQAWEKWVIETNIVGTFKAHSGSGLCTTHFDGKCYLPNGLLRKDAVPTIAPQLDSQMAFKLGIISTLHNHGLNENIYPNQIIDSKVRNDDLDVGNCLKECNQLETRIKIKDEPENFDVGLDTLHIAPTLTEGDHQNLQQPRAMEIKSSLEVSSDQCLGDSSVKTELEHARGKGTMLSGSLTPVISKFNRKSYIGDLSLSDFDTPIRAKQSLAIIKTRFAKQQKKIKVLKQTIRRLKNRNKN